MKQKTISRLAAFALMVGWASGLPAQTEITGVVYGANLNGQAGELLSGANVHWAATQSGTSTHTDGTFRIMSVEGENRLVFSYIGFASDTIAWGGDTFLSVVLKPVVKITEATVTAEGKSTEMSLLNPLNVQKLGERELTKAACCNLSESFETNASVDASYADAVTGTRAIRMLGLDGKYSQILKDNIPNIRGLSTLYGLKYIPGAWIHEIHIAKGAGPVTSGFESMTGEINVLMKSPMNSHRLHVNAYQNNGGRSELNVNVWQKVNRNWQTTLLTHVEHNNLEMDNNKDGFMDNPLLKDAVVRNEWKWQNDHGWEGEYQVTWIGQNDEAGQTTHGREEHNHEELWRVTMKANRLEFSAKTGYVFAGKSWRSFGSQISGVWHEQDNTYGRMAYFGSQQTARVNLLYQSRFAGKEQHGFVTGVSFLHDDYDERMDSLRFVRTEQIPGAFFEYTWKEEERFTLVAGIRADHHLTFGTFISPRLHFRYSLDEFTALKLAAGQGFRTANLIMETSGVLVSSRQWVFHGDAAVPGFGFRPEQAWNAGVNLTRKMTIAHRDAHLALDYYYTNFTDRVVIDFDANPQEVHFYQLEGKSYSQTAQVEFDWSPMRRTDIRLAYRWVEAATQYRQGILLNPMTSRHRGFVNLAYETKENAKGGNWQFDLTANLVGRQRLPDTSSNPEEFQLTREAPDYLLMNAQVTRVFTKNFSLYVGAENLNNFIQPNAIIAPEAPFGPYFDASMLWGPVFGRMYYIGLRWNIERKCD
jgi:outer membrane receptor for ferrienterochelin and colicins